MIEILTPANRDEWLHLRRHTIGASEVAAVLGVHSYMTPYELWSRKIGTWVFTEETKAQRRGRLLEDDCIEILCEERPDWAITPNIIGQGGKFYRDLDIGISATPDALALREPDIIPISSTAGHLNMGVIQIKTVNEHTFREQWTIDGEARVPTYVFIQTIQEAHLTGASWACVAAFVGMDLEPHILDVNPHPELMGKIGRDVPELLRRVRENDPPPPDYARDGEIIRARYAEDDGGEVDLSGNGRVRTGLMERDRLKQFEIDGQLAERERKKIDAELIHLLGNATRGDLGDGRYIEAKTVRKKECVHQATTYRAIKIKQNRTRAPDLARSK